MADETFLDPARQLFASAYFHGGWEGDFCLMAYEVPEFKLEWFRQRGIHIHHVEPFDNDLPRNERAIHSKISIFKKEFHQWDTVVFLDCDMIVQSDINDLISIKKVSGVQAWKLPVMRQRIVTKPKSEVEAALLAEFRKKHNMQLPCINAGLIAYSPATVPATTYDDLVSLYFHYKPILRSYDEVLLSALFGKKIRLLPRHYNCMDFRFSSLYRKAAILHFSGNRKPWKPESPFHRRWLANLKLANQLGKGVPHPPVRTNSGTRKWITNTGLYLLGSTDRFKRRLRFWAIQKPIHVIGKFRRVSGNPS